MSHCTKIESTLFVSTNLLFSENLRCLNLPPLVGAVSQNRSLSSTCFVVAGQSIYSGKFKYSENVNFAGTNNFESTLVLPTLSQSLKNSCKRRPYRFSAVSICLVAQ